MAAEPPACGTIEARATWFSARTTASGRTRPHSSATASCASGGGNLAYLYELTSEAEELFPKAYEPVLCHLSDVLAELLGPEEAEGLLRAVGRRTADERTPYQRLAYVRGPKRPLPYLTSWAALRS